MSLLEGFDQIPDSAVSLRNALAMICDEQGRGDGGSLLAWVDVEMENTRHFAETEEQTESLVELKTPFAMPSAAMQLDYIFIPGVRRAVLENLESFSAYTVKPDGTVTEFLVSVGALTEPERQIIADGCLINYYRNH